MLPAPPRSLALLAALAAGLIALLAAPRASYAACANAIACENALPGSPPAQWQVDGIGDPTIQGFATSMSVNKGQTISFKIKTDSAKYHIDIYRLGYYGGNGARLWQGGIVPSATLPQTQPACVTTSTNGLIDCGNWGVSASWAVPANAVSGVYIARLVREDGSKGASQIPFVVRDDSSTSAMLLRTSDSTWEAYNDYGGNSLYSCTVACPPGNPRAYKAAFSVSYNRPFDGSITEDSGRSYLFYTEYQMIRWVEENGYDVSYTSQSAVSSNPSLLLNHKLIVSNGHDEYWSGQERANVEAARDAGVNLAFFTGNEVFWKTRWENSTADGGSTAYRTLTTYKDTHFDAPTDPVAWTGSWRDPRWSPPGDGGRPENSLTGQLFIVNSGSADMTVPAAYKGLRIWRNTPIASLSAGQSRTLGPGDNLLGYEWDVDVDNGVRPRGEIDLSSTTVNGVESFTDFGSSTQKNTTQTHHLTLYRAPSGALVFGAGTVQWAWGLDTTNAWDNAGAPAAATPDPVVQQATVNLFADQGAQPTTLMSGLVAAAKSTDTTPPTSTITAPAAGASINDGTTVTVSGTAADTGGGVVAGVEVSTDGGTTWHPASGTTSWTYSWTAHGAPTAKIMSRATDDSGNVESAPPSRSVTINCPCMLAGPNVVPAQPDGGDPTPVEVGVKFKADVDGTVNGIRFYKSALNTGTHVGNLWTASGTLLATGTFSNETATGWQQMTFSTPVRISAGTTYVASYYAPQGHYSVTPQFFYTPGPQGGNFLDSPPLHYLSADNNVANGLYTYRNTSTFPTSTYQGEAYGVDVSFSPLKPPGKVTGVTASSAGKTSAFVSWTAPSTGGPVDSYTITPYIGGLAQSATTQVDGGTTATRITGLTNGTTYTFTVHATNTAGVGAESAASGAVTPLNAVAPTAPTNVVARPATSAVLVNWTASTSDGDSAITSYVVTPYLNGTAQPTVSAAATATSATVSGLTNGTAYTFKVAAVNGVGSSPQSSASAAVTPNSTLFDFATPRIIDDGDASAVEIGMKFRTSVNGSVTGVRFYKSAANTGTHVGDLWSSAGTLLASGTFTNESADGWQTLTFASPVAVTAGTTYVVSYYAPKGHYSADPNAFSAQIDNGPLHGLASSDSPDGVYAYSGTPGTFPTGSYQSSNYYVDVTFAVPVPGAPSGVTAAPAGASSATVSWTAPTTGGGVTSYVVTPYVGTTAQPQTTVGGSLTSARVSGLTAGTAYTFTVRAANGSGTGPESSPSGSVTPTGPVAPTVPTNVSALAASRSVQLSWGAPASDGDSPVTSYVVTPYLAGAAQTPISVPAPATGTTVSGLVNGSSYAFTVAAVNAIGTSPASAKTTAVVPADTLFDYTAPANPDSGDATPVELGVKFSSSVAGTVTGIRFYKSALNTGTHVGSLWTTSGARLAEATFQAESATGWQSVTFSSPVTITPGTTYVASYYAPHGHYAVTGSAFSGAGLSNPPLSVPQDSTSGLYIYSGTPSTFPTGSFQASNYWVDVLFQPTPVAVPGAPTGVSAASGGTTSARVAWTAPTTGGAPDDYRVTPYVNGVAQTATVVAGSASTAKVTGLTTGTTYTFTVRGENAGGLGAESAASNAVTPSAPVAPDAPTGVSAQPATNSVQVSWTAPGSDGDSPITGYVVTPYLNGTAQTTVNAGATATAAVVTGLTNGSSYTFKVAAVNAVGSSPQSAATAAVVPEATLFDFSGPAAPDSGDGASVEVGVQFSSSTAGSVTGIRFYKATANTGTHVGSLWSASGTLLARATFAGETASGWQTVTFSSPVAITAGTTYVASYFAPKGHYAQTASAFAAGPVANGPLQALQSVAGAGNGLYSYGSSSTFPTSSSQASNYWVDVEFAGAGS